jgi:hypothetical protein
VKDVAEQLAISMKMSMPVTATGGLPLRIQVPLDQEMACPGSAGAVQPVGTVISTCEPAEIVVAK